MSVKISFYNQQVLPTGEVEEKLTPRRGGVVLCPVPRKRRCSQELLVGVLLVHVYRFEVFFDQSIAQQHGALDELRLGEVGVEDKRLVLGLALLARLTKPTYPVTTKHLAGEVHAESSDHAWFASEESVVEQRHFHQEFRQGSGLNVIVVRL